MGRGCPKCGIIKTSDIRRFSKEDFVEKANLIHTNFYDYSKAVYKNSGSKVTIICPMHGEFSQLANTHTQGGGCKSCGIIKSGLNGRVGKIYILNKFKEKHKNFYSYDLDINVKTNDMILITCPIHGDFKQLVSVHYYSGCPECGNNRVAIHQRKKPKELDKLCRNIRRRIKGFIKSQGYKKSSKTSEIIDISWSDLKIHLENNPYGFTIDCEDLDVDHIVPLCSIKEEEDIYKLNHYTNLQLLPRVYNQFVKKERPFDKLHFNNWLIETNYNAC